MLVQAPRNNDDGGIFLLNTGLKNAIIAYINPLIQVNQKTEMGYRF